MPQIETADLIAEVEDLLAKATPGPWAAARKTTNLTEIYAVGGRGSVADVSRWEGGIAGSDGENSANADLIVRARNDLLRRSVDEIKRLRSLVRHMDLPTGD